MSRILLLSLFVSIILSGCSPQLSPFTQELIHDYQYDDAALSRIQFYLSDDIVLHRELSRGESIIDEGRISIRNGRRVEEIIFREGTPGVYEFSPGNQRLAISFERNKEHYLIFGPSKNSRRYRGNEGVYRLLAKKWERDYGLITYGGKEYYTPAQSAYVTLLVSIDEKGRVERRVKEVGGREVR